MLLLRSSTLICLMIWRFVSRSCLAFSIIPRLIQPRRCYCIRLEMMFKCFASINPLSESRRSFQWMLLSNIPWMAPDGMAFKKNYTNKQIKAKWTAAPSNNCFKLLAGILDNRPFYRYGSHIELIRFKEYYRMPRGHEHISFEFSSAFRHIFS